MKTRKSLSIAVIMLLTLFLAGCRTSRTTESSARLSRKQRSEILVPLAQYPATVQAVTAKTAITFDYNGLSATLKGRLRMRRDEVVQMTITALGLMEIASIEFTPQGAYIIDKVNKRYAMLDFSSLRMSYAGINFNAVQALFWNRIFIPGEKDVWRKVDEFTLTDAGAQRLIEPSRQRTLKCKFYADANCKELQQTTLALQHYTTTWRYGQFDTIDTYTYPTTFDLSISGSSRAIGARIDLTNVSTLDTGWNGLTDLSRYKEADIEQLMSILNIIR